jgi:hypothetical protein
MHGFFATRAMGSWRAEVPPAFIGKHLPPSDPTTDPFIPRPQFALDPVRWTKEEEDRFTRPHDDFALRAAQDQSSIKSGETNSAPPTDGQKGNDSSDADHDATNEGEKNDPLPDW